jgi:LacI family transcriptional regulator
MAQLGIQLVSRPVRSLGEGDTEAFQELIESGVDGIILTAGNPRALKPLIDDAEQRGIRVVCVSTDAPESRRSSVVCVEPSLNGSLAGELMGKFVSPGSQVAVVTGMLKAEDHRKKTEAFSESFPRHCPGGEIVDVIEGHEDEDESFQKTYDLLGCVPSLAGLYVNTVNRLPVCRALGARGLAGSVRLITTDLFSEMSPCFRKGTITASIYQQPHRQGQLAVRILADTITNKAPFPTTSHLSPGVVMSANLNVFREMRLADCRPDDSALRPRVRMAV